MKHRRQWPFATVLALLGSVLLSLLSGAWPVAARADTPEPGDAGQGTADESIVLGMGCFWGAEQRMSELPGVLDVEAGYANGDIAGTYEAILAHERARRLGATDRRNHAEVVKVRFDPTRIRLEQVLAKFWENHDPTQGDRQGNDVGSNYRSAIYTDSPAQAETAQRTRAVYQTTLTHAGRGAITTEIAPLSVYVRAEEAHQDYLRKHPLGYCGLGGTGISYPDPADRGAPRSQPVDATPGNTKMP